MLDKFLQNAIEDAGATGRLREMIGVLRKREVVRGMTPVKLRQVLEDLGPTFVKLGQIMSMRPASPARGSSSGRAFPAASASAPPRRWPSSATSWRKRRQTA